jgi:hypothetical protein
MGYDSLESQFGSKCGFAPHLLGMLTQALETPSLKEERARHIQGEVGQYLGET